MGLFDRFRKPKQPQKVVVVKVNKVKNFRYLEDLINSGKNEIKLDADIVLEASEKYRYSDGIDLSAKNLVINGNGHTIDACGKTRIFKCLIGKNITLKNITFKNGFSKERGGAIYNIGDNMAIENCTFAENVVTHEHGNGGAIYAGNEMTITGSAFNGNVIIGEHGNGGAISNSGKLTISKSAFANNMIIGKYGYGGAIFNLKRATVKESAFNHNLVKDSGGAIYNSINGYLNVENSKFEKNMAQSKCNIHDSPIYRDSNTYDDTRYDKNYVELIFQVMLEKIKNK